MKAAWDWHLPRETDEQARELIEFAAELGFDTLVIHDPTSVLMASGEELGLRVVSIVTPNLPDTVASGKPRGVQRLTPGEEALAKTMRGGPRDYDHRPSR